MYVIKIGEPEIGRYLLMTATYTVKAIIWLIEHSIPYELVTIIPVSNSVRLENVTADKLDFEGMEEQINFWKEAEHDHFTMVQSRNRV